MKPHCICGEPSFHMWRACATIVASQISIKFFINTIAFGWNVLYLCKNISYHTTMNTIALQRSRLAGILSTLSVDDMAWAMKFLTDKLSAQTKQWENEKKTDAELQERAKPERFLARVCGTWNDDKDADEMVHDIYSSRVNKDFSEIENLFNE